MELNQILEQVTKTKDQRNADIEAAAQELINVRQLIEEAHAVVDAAAAAGDPDTYASAKQREDYNRKRAETLERKQTAPAYTAEQYRGLVDQAFKQAKVEVLLLYKRLHDIAEEWKETCAQIKEKDGIVWHINREMQNSVGNDAFRSYGMPTVPGVYDIRLMEAIDRYALNTIGYYYKPEKEA